MIVIYFRSSSVNTYELCPHKFFITYVLGKKEPTNKAASKGSLVHKVMECLAWKKKCEQDGLAYFDDDIEGKIYLSECYPELLFDRFKNYYAAEPESQWTKKDFSEAWQWVQMALTAENGMHDPRRMNIVHPELFFDMEIPFDWATYEYKVNDQVLSGRLRLRGSVDLVADIGNNTYLVTDYKTGARINRKTNIDKTLKDLSKDFQFRIYTWALHQLFPDKNIEFEVFFIKDGGPFRLYIDKEDAQNTAEHELRRLFYNIKNSNKPDLAKGNREIAHVCNFCPWNRKLWNPDDVNSNTVCYEVADLVRKNGAHKVFEMHGNIASLNEYTGGGKTLDLNKD